MQDFIEIRDSIDRYAGFNPKPGTFDPVSFDVLFDLFAEVIADFNRDYWEKILGEEDPESIMAFDDCTLKHQVFDYFPYNNFPQRETKENDISTVIAGLLVTIRNIEMYNKLDGLI